MLIALVQEAHFRLLECSMRCSQQEAAIPQMGAAPEGIGRRCSRSMCCPGSSCRLRTAAATIVLQMMPLLHELMRNWAGYHPSDAWCEYVVRMAHACREYQPPRRVLLSRPLRMEALIVMY